MTRGGNPESTTLGESYLATGRNKRTCSNDSHDYSGRCELLNGGSCEGISFDSSSLLFAMTIHSIVFNYSYTMACTVATIIQRIALRTHKCELLDRFDQLWHFTPSMERNFLHDRIQNETIFITCESLKFSSIFSYLVLPFRGYVQIKILRSPWYTNLRKERVRFETFEFWDAIATWRVGEI